MRAQCKDFRRVEMSALRNYLVRSRQHMRKVIHARTVRHRRRMHDAIALRNTVHIGEVAQRCTQQVAMRDHHPFRPPGSAAGVEQPRDIVRHARMHCTGIARAFQRGILFRARLDHMLQVRHRARADRLRQVGGDEAGPRAGVLQDELEFARMQLGIHRNRDQARVPRRVQHLDILRAVAHRQRDPVARLQAQALPQPCGHRRDTMREFAVANPYPVAERDRRIVRKHARGAREQVGDIHRLEKISKGEPPRTPRAPREPDESHFVLGLGG